MIRPLREREPPPRQAVVKTTILARVREAVAHTRSLRSPSLIVGPPGIGKTISLEHIAATDEDAVLIRFATRYRTINGIYKALLEVTEWPTYHKHGYDLEHAAEACAQHLVRYGGIVLLDEYQNFDLNAIRALLGLYDQFKLPIVFAGNKERMMRAGADAHTYEQISTRIAKRVTLTSPTRADIEAIGVEYNVEGREAFDAMVAFTLQTSLRQLVQMLDAARQVRGKRGSLRLEHLEAGHDHLNDGGRPSATLISFAPGAVA